MKRDTRLRLVALAAFLLPSLAAPASAFSQADARTQLDRALAALDRTEIEEGVALLIGLLQDPGATDPALLGTAHFKLGEAYFSLGTLDSARRYFRETVSADPFLVVDAELYQPNLVAAFDAARRQTAAVALRAPGDTVLDPTTDSMPIDIAIGAPGELTLVIGRGDEEGAAGRDTLLSIQDGRRHSLSLMESDSVAMAPGVYRLSAVLDAPDVGTDSASITLTVERLPADTLPLVAPPGPSQLLPEFSKGAAPVSSVVRGLLIGGAVAAMPIVISNRALRDGLEPRSLVVGATIGLAGVVGLILGRPDLPIGANITTNQRMMTSWRARNQAVTVENRLRVLLAPMRVTSGRNP